MTTTAKPSTDGLHRAPDGRKEKEEKRGERNSRLLCRLPHGLTITLEDRRNDRVWGLFYDRISGDFERGGRAGSEYPTTTTTTTRKKKSKENAESPKTLTKWLVHKKREGAHQILPIHSIIYRSGGGGGGGSAAWHERAGQQHTATRPGGTGKWQQAAGEGWAATKNERKTPNKTLRRVGCCCLLLTACGSLRSFSYFSECAFTVASTAVTAESWASVTSGHRFQGFTYYVHVDLTHNNNTGLQLGETWAEVPGSRCYRAQ